MRYYLIVGETSGDLHAAHLMQSLRKCDAEADFRFFGGDNMIAVGGTCVKHCRELAYMGFVPVLLHLRTIFRNMGLCKRDIIAWQPDVVILVDYAGFNLSIARFLRRKTSIPVYYYIAPKIWAWKEYRIKNIKRDVEELFSILPFEVPFFEGKHHYPINYVGNPTADEVRSFLASYNETTPQFLARHGIDTNNEERPIIALLPGSRRQEIKDNLPTMLRACAPLSDQYHIIIAGAPAIEREYYERFVKGVCILHSSTYPLLSHATAALVTSGTATLETALFNVPQVVCYKTPLPRLIRFAFNHVIKVPFISLVNLIANREIVPELLADRFSEENIRCCLADILPGGKTRQTMLDGYTDVRQQLGDTVAPDNAAKLMVEKLAMQD